MTTAIAIVAFLIIAGGAFVVAGVHFLAGMAWAFIAAGLMLFGAGVYLRLGLMPHD